MPDVAFARRKKSEAVPGRSAAVLKGRLAAGSRVQFVLNGSRRLIAGKNVMNAVGSQSHWEVEKC